MNLDHSKCVNFSKLKRTMKVGDVGLGCTHFEQDPLQNYYMVLNKPKRYSKTFRAKIDWDIVCEPCYLAGLNGG